jgi:hypothetical protein
MASETGLVRPTLVEKVALSKTYIFEQIFGMPLSALPVVMQKHYAVRANSEEKVFVQGVMAIRQSRFIRWLSPALRLLVPRDGEEILSVTFYSGLGSSDFHFDRSLNLPGQPPFRFHSRLVRVRENEAVEVMRGGIGWRSRYRAQGDRVFLRHMGYCWQLGSLFVPIPLMSWIIGRGAAEEQALTDDHFKMWMIITHPVFGEVYRRNF